MEPTAERLVRSLWRVLRSGRLLALGALTAFVILVLDGAMANWLAALIVGLAYTGIAALLYMRGKDKVEDAGSPAPRQTIETLKEDVEWAKHPTRSATR